MSELVGAEADASAGSLTTRAFSESDLAHAVTSWLLSNFRQQLADSVRSTPFTSPLLCAIACREAGAYWLPLTPHRSPAEILGLCVYDASGDVPGTSRRAFPTNRAQFQLAYGEAFTTMLVEEANKARAARGLSPAGFLYKGYGIFQYDLQFVRSDDGFFRSRKWYSFDECVSRAVRELTKALETTRDIQESVRAYNGSGPKAEQYARDVMRLLPFCEQAAVGRQAQVDLSFEPSPEAGGPLSTAMPSPGDDDPASPRDGELSETADFETARVLANLGGQEPADVFSMAEAAVPVGTAGMPLVSFDLSRAEAFLEACETSNPRVTYGLGAKVPFLGAVPGRDFTKVDCSGFVREAVRRATTPPLPFPDGSVNQHDWVRAHGLERTSVSASLQDDGAVRIAFLRPQDTSSHIGHVVLVAGRKTLESHGGTGPDSRAWDGLSWQSKAFVYIFAPSQQTGAAKLSDLARPGRMFTVHHGKRYRASITLSGFERFAGNARIQQMLESYGFTNVSVTGNGGIRVAEALWPGPDTTAPLDPHLGDIIELPAVGEATARSPRKRRP